MPMNPPNATYTSSASTTGAKSLSIADIERVMREIDLLPKETDWMLAAPDGRCWKGKPEQLLAILLPHHPLLKMPTWQELLKPVTPGQLTP